MCGVWTWWRIQTEAKKVPTVQETRHRATNETLLYSHDKSLWIQASANKLCSTSKLISKMHAAWSRTPHNAQLLPSSISFRRSGNKADGLPILPIQTHTTNTYKYMLTYKHSLHKVSQADACEGTALWNEASKPEAKLKVNVREAHLEVLFCQKGKAVTLKQTSNEVRPSLCDEVLASFPGCSRYCYSQ